MSESNYDLSHISGEPSVEETSYNTARLSSLGDYILMTGVVAAMTLRHPVRTLGKMVEAGIEKCKPERKDRGKR